MLKIDFDGSEVDIKSKFQDTLKLTLKTIIILNIIDQLQKNTLTNAAPNKIDNMLSSIDTIMDFYYSDRICEEYKVDQITAFDFLDNYFKKLRVSENPHENKELFLTVAKEAAIEKYIVEYECTSTSDEVIFNIFSRDLDFINSDFKWISELFDIIEKSESKNKEDIIKTTYKSFSRTIVSYIDSLSKEYVASIFSNSYFYVTTLLEKKNNVLNESNQKIDSLIKNSVSGRKIKNIISDFYDFKEDENCSVYKKYKVLFKSMETIINSRNEITHRYNPDEVHYNNIVKNWENYSNLLISLHEEYTYSDNEGHEILKKKCIEKMHKISNDNNYVLNKLIPMYLDRFA